MKKKYTIRNEELFLTVVLLTGVFLRYLVIFRGNNYDFESYLIVGEIVKNHGSVYAETGRYNYGPAFFWIQGGLYTISNLFLDVRTAYRFLIVSFLTTIDVCLFFFVRKKKDLFWGAVFFLNPVSIIISGYHNQFDNVAVLLAVIAIDFIVEGDAENSNRMTKKEWIGVLCLAASLIFKHVMFLYPVWILFNKNLLFKKRLVIATVPPVLFLGSFVPFCPKGLDGIIHNVFLYRSHAYFPIIGKTIFGHIIPGYGSNITQPFIIYIIILTIFGLCCKNYSLEKSILIYLMAMVCFSSAMANQYLVIPIVAMIILCDKWAFIYFIIAGVFLILEDAGLHLKDYIVPHGKIIEGLASTGYMYTLCVWCLLGYLGLVILENKASGQFIKIKEDTFQ